MGQLEERPDRLEPGRGEPWERNKPDSERVFFPLTDQVVFRHLSRPESGQRQLHVGLYPMLPDDTTRLLACDFDDKDWRGDAAAYIAACKEVGVPALAEISRSGSGAHVWIFFTAPVPATLARALGTALLRRAIDTRKGMSLASYDRFSPAQDFLPIHSKGGARFGNLIALPLHGASRGAGTTVFCDPATWHPYPDQFAHLSRAERLTPHQVQALVDKLGPVQAGPSPTTPVLPPRPRRTALGKAPKTVNAEAGAMLRITTTGLPPQLVAALKHAASLHNPEFYRRQNQRCSTFNTPRMICCFDATDPEWLALPRGLRDEAAIRKVDAERWIGLSATPYRADQMDPLITMQCGPIRHEIEDQSTFAKHLIVHRTTFSTGEPGTDGASIQAIYGKLAADGTRNQLIAADIATAYRRGRCSLALTNRIEHVNQLAAALKEHGIEAMLLHGGLPTSERDLGVVLLPLAGELLPRPALETVRPDSERD
ncbi:hypothetical protein AB0M03_23705, partial [Kitasatospora sp. NPDC051914]